MWVQAQGWGNILDMVFFFFFKDLFIYSFIQRERGRDTGRGRSRPHAGSLMRKSWKSRITPQAAGGTKPAWRGHCLALSGGVLWGAPAFSPDMCILPGHLPLPAGPGRANAAHPRASPLQGVPGEDCQAVRASCLHLWEPAVCPHHCRWVVRSLVTRPQS